MRSTFLGGDVESGDPIIRYVFLPVVGKPILHCHYVTTEPDRLGLPFVALIGFINNDHVNAQGQMLTATPCSPLRYRVIPRSTSK